MLCVDMMTNGLALILTAILERSYTMDQHGPKANLFMSLAVSLEARAQ